MRAGPLAGVLFGERLWRSSSALVAMQACMAAIVESPQPLPTASPRVQLAPEQPARLEARLDERLKDQQQRLDALRSRRTFQHDL